MRLILFLLLAGLLTGCASKAQLDSTTDPGVTPAPLQQLTVVASEGFDPVHRPGVEQDICKALSARLDSCSSFATAHLPPSRMADLSQAELMAKIDPSLYPVLLVQLDRDRTQSAERGSGGGSFVIGGGYRSGGAIGFGTQVGSSGPPMLYFTYHLRLLEQPGDTPLWLATARSRSQEQPDRSGSSPLKQLVRSLEEDLVTHGWLKR
ncbi:hypothetical protein [Marinospirillum alkaliphilum]|uniref:DUF4136 domain-containing protein n=1 Tax=Marinospirillum alkaliphilum DSM 21637 TaxID=1122209 RepID=A0A1K1WYB1_9GAMM|nr:hypothetical protein [Marinospirillum alkaliphilum]SFX42417.1 hypothetical protein SAMN02745752_01602 [Marinospirillum alkaliphilum DSM 21637]